MLADKKSRNAIAKETGLSKRQVDKIIAWKLGTGGPGGTGFEREPGPRENTWVFVPKSTSRRTSRRSAATARQGTDEPRIY